MVLRQPTKKKYKEKIRNNKKAIHFFELAGTIQHDSDFFFE